MDTTTTDQPSSQGNAPGATPVHDPVDFPKHYQGKSMQVINVIEAWRCNAHMSSVFRYILRAPHKNGIQDLQKAIWYLKRMATIQTGPLQTENVLGPEREKIIDEFGVSDHIAHAYFDATIAIRLGKDFLIRRPWLEYAIDYIEQEIADLDTSLDEPQSIHSGSGGVG